MYVEIELQNVQNIGTERSVHTLIRLLLGMSDQNSVEHEILNAHKYISISFFFQTQIRLECYFFTAHKC